jgi:hypothetical protein
MSKDIIYREDAIKAINARSNWYQVTCNGKQIAVMLMAKDVNEILEKVPSADRPQGEWIVNISNYESICSVCGANETDFIYGTEMWYGLGKSKFCPNCGARMK